MVAMGSSKRGGGSLVDLNPARPTRLSESGRDDRLLEEFGAWARA